MDRLLKSLLLPQFFISSRRSSRLCFALLVWSAFVGLAGAQQFPYVAYVTGEQIYVRSGPGQSYYPTGQIPQGFAVEVYRHDGDSWCAIRPPAGSFSWVPSHQVRAAGEGVVEIVGEQVVARVGSGLSPNRSAVQVLLPKGERLELIVNNENDDPRWVRVAAPAGEFRWVAASSLSRRPPMETAPQPEGLGWKRQSERPSADVPIDSNAFAHLSPPENANPTGLQFGQPHKEISSELTPLVRNDPSAIDLVEGSPAELQLAQFQLQPSSLPPPNFLDSAATTLPQHQSPLTQPPQTQHLLTQSPPTKSSQPRIRFRGLTPPVTATLGSVEELELRLSQAVVQSPKQWELDSLEAAATRLLSETKSPPVRAQLREVLARITRFQQVHQRYTNPTPPALSRSALPASDPFETAAAVDSASSGLTGLSPSVRERAREDLAGDSSQTASAGIAASADKPLYDATGLLKPVISKRESAPQYALVDEQGKVVSFITPTPDLNLKPYVGHHIGVHGKRGFMPEYRRTHVTAGRVTPLERTLRR